MNLLPAERSDAAALTALTFRSKAHWGYSTEQMEAWRQELTISAADMAMQTMVKLVAGGRLIGYYSFFPESATQAKLENLFIEPEEMGKGYGHLLMKDFFARIAALGFEKARLVADPHAEKFYKKLGFQVVGEWESAIKNRFLPVMERNLIAGSHLPT